MAREDFEGIAELARQNHKERVAKNPSRMEYAINQLEKAGVEYRVCSEANCHIQARRQKDDELINFWAGTGKIQGYTNLRGIHNLIKLCKEV